MFSLAPPPLAVYVERALQAAVGRNHGKAIEHAREGLRDYPAAAVLWVITGIAQEGDLDYATAAVSYQRALALQPGHPEATINLGNCRRALGDPEAALALYAQITDGEQAVLAATNRASTLCQLHRLEDAAAVLQPLPASHPERNTLLGLLRLGEGDFANGWRLYQSRVETATRRQELAVLQRPRAVGPAEVAGRHVLVLHEQGYGDTLQFCRYLPHLSRLAAKVTLLCPKSLTALLRRSMRQYRHIDVISEREQVVRHDVEMFMLDLPLCCGTSSLDRIPSAALPYLTAADWGPMYQLAADGRRRIGVCWAGDRRPGLLMRMVDEQRSLALAALHPLADLPNTAFYSLQIGPAAGQEAAFPVPMARPLNHEWHVMEWLPANHPWTWDATAAIVDQLDAVVTVDTAVAHLAGGLGKPVYLLSRFNGCWRWGAQGSTTPWYPTMRIFRQPSPGDWASPIAALKAALA